MDSLRLTVSASEANGGLWMLALLSTYVVHASLFAAVAMVITRWFARRSSTAHALWKGALMAPILTAALSVAFARSAEESWHALIVVQPQPGAPPAHAQQDNVDPMREVPWALVLDYRYTSLLLPLLLGCGLVGFVRIVRSALALRRVVHARVPVVDARLRERFFALTQQMGQHSVSLTESA